MPKTPHFNFKRPKTDIQTISKFKVTIILFLAVIMGYLILSNLNPFIPVSQIRFFSATISSPMNLLIYFLIHISYGHLLINLFYILAFSSIVESRLNSKDSFLIFILSALIPAIIFLIQFPLSSLAGASAAAHGLLGAALMLDLKKSFFMLTIIFFVLFFSLLPLIDIQSKELVNQENTKLNKLKTDFQKAVEEKDVEKQELLKLVLEKQTKKAVSLGESYDNSVFTPANPLIHVYAILVGAFFVLFLRKKQSIFGKYNEKSIFSEPS